MQRQSLGSPGSNHHHSHGGVTVVNSPLTAATESSQDSKRLSLTSPLAFNGVSDSDEEEEEKTKLLKPSHRSSLSSPKQKKGPEKMMIHGIPILTFLCFLILYLSSHDPSQFEMDAFGGFKNRPETTTTTLTDTRSASGATEIGKVVEANRRRRDLRAGHRKLGDF